MKRFAYVLMVCLLAFGATLVGAQEDTKDPNDSDTFTPSGAGIPIPDDAYDGTLASMVCMTTDAPAGTITAMDVDITVEHSWVGDLVFKLVSPSDEVLTMMSRPSLAEAADDGTECCGASSNLIASSPLSFADGNTFDAEMMGATLGTDEFVCQDDGECDFFANPGAGPGTDFSQFNGQDAARAWQVCVGDGAGGDTGSLLALRRQATVG